MISEPSHVLSDLMLKRAELVDQLEHHHAMIRQMLIELDSVDATLRLFDADIMLNEMRLKAIPPRHRSYRGEVAEICLPYLRDAETPQTTEQVAMHFMAERDMNWGDKPLARTVLNRVGACLRHYRDKGLLISIDNQAGRLEWSMSHASTKSRLMPDQ